MTLAQASGGPDLVDLWRGTLTPRRLLVLIRAAPVTSPLWVAIREDVDQGAEQRRLDHITSRAEFYAARGRKEA